MGTTPDNGEQLAQRARELSSRAANELLGQATREFQSLSEGFAASHLAADEALAVQERRFDDARKQAAMEGERLRSTVGAALRELDAARSDIESQLNIPGGSLQTATAQGAHSAWGAAALAAAVSDVRDRVAAAKHLNVPAMWPASPSGRAMVLSTLLLGLVAWPLVLVWPVTVVAWHFVARRSRDNTFRQLQVEALQLKHTLNAFVVRVNQVEAEERGKADCDILQPAKDAHRQAVIAAERARNLRLTHLTQQAAALSKELREKSELLCEQLQWASLSWGSERWGGWTPAQAALLACQVGVLRYHDQQLDKALGTNTSVSVPALVSLDNGAVVLSASGGGMVSAYEALRSCMFRLLATSPPGAVRFVLIDPAGFGRNVSDLMPLGDVSRELVGGKAWSEPSHIEEQLGVVAEHIQTLIQRRLGDHKSLVDYNASLGRIAEPYRYLFIFDYPTNFTDVAVRRLAGIVIHGPKCGVYTLIVRDTSQKPLYGLRPDAALTSTQSFDHVAGSEWRWSGAPGEPLLTLDSVSGGRSAISALVKQWGGHAQATALQELPFTAMLRAAGLTKSAWWTGSSAKALRIAIGMAGQRVQYLELGIGIAHSVLIGGATGSGKTNLIHVLVSSACLSMPPSELTLYLVDLKGVGFIEYARGALPHAAVVAVDADREFGVSVISTVEHLMRERAERFKEVGASDVADYRLKRPSDPMSRVLLAIDEFQELFASEDRIAVRARQSLEHIGRMGRGFGIHLILSTQTLSSTAQLPNALLGQINVRIALDSRDPDSRLILGAQNAAATGLSQGEAIYNAGGGAVASNVRCQVPRFRPGEDMPMLIAAVKALAAANGVKSRPIVFDGASAPVLRDCRPLRALERGATWASGRKRALGWLGEPVGVGEPIAAVFERRSNRNLLVVSNNEDEGTSVVLAAWVSLMCQYRPAAAHFRVLDLSSPDRTCSARVSRMQDLFAHKIDILDNDSVPAVLSSLNQTISTAPRGGRGASGVSEFLVVLGLHRATALRDDPAGRGGLASIAAGSGQSSLATLLRGGPDAGVHALIWCDTVRNTRRAIGRDLADVGIRVVGPLGAEESSAVLESVEASRLNRPGRLLFWDSDSPSEVVKFRPYSIDNADWLTTLAVGQQAWREGSAEHER